MQSLALRSKLLALASNIGMLPRPLQNLAEALSKLPGIGPKHATRVAFYLLRHPKLREDIDGVLGQLAAAMTYCARCKRSVEKKEASEVGLCSICNDPHRDKTLLSIVEEDIDLEQLEATKAFPGRYFVLGGRVTPRGGPWLKGERLEALKRLVESEKGVLKEMIIALNPSAEGDFGAYTLQAALKPFGIKISRLGRGLPLGGEIEYADEETLRGALEHRG